MQAVYIEAKNGDVSWELTREEDGALYIAVDDPNCCELHVLHYSLSLSAEDVKPLLQKEDRAD